MTTEAVTSAEILREVRARVLTLVKVQEWPLPGDMTSWEVQLMTLAKLEVIYSQPQVIPLATGDTRFQVRP